MDSAETPEDLAALRRRKGALARLAPSQLTPWRIVRIIGLALALALLAALVVHLGPARIGAHLVAAGPGFVWILLLHAIAIALSGLPWHVLLPRGVRPRLRDSIASRFVAAGANAVLPIVAFAGDLVRLWWLPRRQDRAVAVAAMVVDRLTYGVANTLLVLAGALALVYVAALPPVYTRAAFAAVIGLVVALAVAAVVATRYRVVGRVHRWIRRLRRKHEDAQFGDDVDAAITVMLRSSSSSLWIALAYNVLSRVAVSAEIYIAFRLLGVHLAVDQALVFAALPIVIALAGALVPSQLGVQEGAQALIASSFGIPPTIAVAVVLLLRLRSLAGGFLVWFLLARRVSVPLSDS